MGWRETVTKDELIDGVWLGAIVEDNVIQVNILVIRRALGPDPRLLLTAPGRGYCVHSPWTARRDYLAVN